MRGGGFVVVFTLGALVAIPVAPAAAGSYTVNACMDDARGANLSWSATSTHVDLPSYSAGCVGSAPEGLIARAAAKPSGGLVAAFASAAWSFDAPSATTIDHADLSLLLYRFGGGLTDRWGVGVGDETGAYLLGGIGQSAMATGSRGSYFAITVSNRTSLRLGVVCANADGCTVQATNVASARYSRASTELFGARVRINDPTTATLSSESGALWTASSWLAGRQALNFVASDNVGIASLAASVGGERQVVRSDCDYARPAPCPSSREFSGIFDTTGLSDGAHTVTAQATDSGGNLSSNSRQVLIDNTAPGPAGAPRLSGAAATVWRTINDFTLTYSNPPKGTGAPLSSHDVQLCALSPDGSINPDRCAVDSRSGAPEMDAVQLPSVGSFRMRVRVNDEVFKGAWSDWSPQLLFDDTVPGTPVVRFPAGWVNRASVSTPLTLMAPTSGSAPPSGYGSYRVAVDGGPPTVVPADGKSASASFEFGALSDGVHNVSVGAVSGAGIETPPLSKASGHLRKDVVAPVLAVAGAPAHGAFVTAPVTLAMTGTDATSGMAGAIAPEPVTSGGFIATQVDHGALALTAGPFARLSPGEGEHLVQGSAADVAGNRSAVQSFAYTQDTEPPRGGLRPIRAAQPALLEFFIDERCTGRAVIEIATAPGAWQPLATSESIQSAAASVPPAIWEPRTPYTVRAIVSDCAGNTATLTDWYGGERSGTAIGTILPPPRAATSATVAVTPVASGASVSSAALREVTTIVRDSKGDPLAGLEVRFEIEPWMTPARWLPAGSARTDAKGRATAKLAAHSSVRIRALVPGDELRQEAISNTAYATRLASSTISARPRVVRAGRSTRIEGRLRGGWVPRSGLQLSLYGRGPRSRGWVPIRTGVAVSSSGYWRTPYRFLRSSRGRFYFRVRTPNRPDYPFRSASSRPLRVIVR